MEQNSSSIEDRLDKIERAVKVPLHRRKVSKWKERSVRKERVMYFLKVVFEFAVRLFLNVITGG